MQPLPPGGVTALDPAASPIGLVERGPQGASAYDVYVSLGGKLTREQWSAPPAPGRDGASAYDLAGGDAEWGSLPAWLASLASGGAERSYAIAIAAHGQTVLPISPPPALLSTLCLTVNGIDYRAPLALSATELAVTWSGGFALDPSDDVHVSYF